MFDERLAAVTPGQIFRWPRGGTITAIDAVVIALPMGPIQDNETMGEVVAADGEMNVAMPPDSENIHLSFQPGMSVTIKRNSQSYLVAGDTIPRRIRITEP